MARSLVVLFHYTTQLGFANITDHNRESAEIFASLQDENALFGQGVYATQRAPDAFGSREAVLRNNYRTQIDEDPALLEQWRDRAAYCVPVIAERRVAFNVAERATPEMPGPGVNRSPRKHNNLKNGFWWTIWLQGGFSRDPE